MEVLDKSQPQWVRLCNHHRLVQWDMFDSELVVPEQQSDRLHPRYPPTLTIRIHYSLNFADGIQGTLRPGIIGWVGPKYYVKDSNGEWFEVEPWNFASSANFANKFQGGAAFWDRKFALIPSGRFSLLDYDVIVGNKVQTWRPNIVCRFQLVGGPILNPSDKMVQKKGSQPVHLSIDAIRSERPLKPWWYFLLTGSPRFRSNAALYDARNIEVNERVLWHEIGHAMDQDHIQALANGKNSCANNSHGNGEDHCYVTPPHLAEDNVMGKGTGLALENGKTWMRAIDEHLVGERFDWMVSRDVTTPARLIRVEDYDPNPPPRPKGPGPGFHD